MADVESAPTLILNGRANRRKREITPIDKIVDTPFLKITPNFQQACLSRDALAALGRPEFIVWWVYGSGDDKRIRIIAVKDSVAAEKAKETFVVSYIRRMSAVVTVPQPIRDVLTSRRYWACAWTEAPKNTDEKERNTHWVEFTTGATSPLGGTVVTQESMERKKGETK